MVCFASAASPHVFYDTKVDGKIISKVKYSLNEEGLLNKEVKNKLNSYNETGKVSEKKTYRWNKTTGNLNPYYWFHIEYNQGNQEKSVDYGMWDKKKGL